MLFLMVKSPILSIHPFFWYIPKHPKLFIHGRKNNTSTNQRVDRQVEPPTEQVEKLTLRVQKAVLLSVAGYGPQKPWTHHRRSIGVAIFWSKFFRDWKWISEQTCVFLLGTRKWMWIEEVYFSVSRSSVFPRMQLGPRHDNHDTTALERRSLLSLRPFFAGGWKADDTEGPFGEGTA